MAISACSDRFAVLDTEGAVSLYFVDLSNETVANVGQLPPMQCPSMPVNPISEREPRFALGCGVDGRSIVLSVW